MDERPSSWSNPSSNMVRSVSEIAVAVAVRGIRTRYVVLPDLEWLQLGQGIKGRLASGRPKGLVWHRPFLILLLLFSICSKHFRLSTS